jgi:prepilin-type processing-associated H-X9-DG protein
MWSHHAYTLIDLLVGVVFLMLLVAVVVILPARSGRIRSRAPRINCTCNLKQVGLAYKQWALDNQDRYPMQVSVTNGGTMEFVNSGTVWVHFRVLSNELNTPKVLWCPADEARRGDMANTFGAATQPGHIPFTNDNNVSYFVGVDATDTNADAAMFLSGDRNLTNHLGHSRRLVDFPTNQAAGWTHQLHNNQGNIGLADGSVQQFSTSRLRAALIYTDHATNRLAMP